MHEIIPTGNEAVFDIKLFSLEHESMVSSMSNSITYHKSAFHRYYYDTNVMYALLYFLYSIFYNKLLKYAYIYIYGFWFNFILYVLCVYVKILQSKLIRK